MFFFLKWSCYGVYPTRIPENMAFMVHPMSTTSHCSFHGSTSNTSEYIPHLIACITDISYVNYVRTSPYAKSSIFFSDFPLLWNHFLVPPWLWTPQYILWLLLVEVPVTGPGEHWEFPVPGVFGSMLGTPLRGSTLESRSRMSSTSSVKWPFIVDLPIKHGDFP